MFRMEFFSLSGFSAEVNKFPIREMSPILIISVLFRRFQFEFLLLQRRKLQFSCNILFLRARSAIQAQISRWRKNDSSQFGKSWIRVIFCDRGWFVNDVLDFLASLNINSLC